MRWLRALVGCYHEWWTTGYDPNTRMIAETCRRCLASRLRLRRPTRKR